VPAASLRLLLALGFLTGAAHAQPAQLSACPEQDATVCGRRHFEAGTQAFEKADFAGAAAEFQAAIAERPHAVIRFNLALSLARLGHPSAAAEQLRLVLGDGSTDPELRARAERELRSAEQALARVTLRLSDPRRERVELDGSQVGPAGAGELGLDPGTHHVRVISGASVVLDQDLELSPGERVELSIGERSRRIDVVVVPDAVGAAPVTHAERAVVVEQPAGLSPVWFYAALGGTALLSGLTLWSGLDTKRALSDYRRDLPELDQAQADQRVDAGHRKELRTNLLLAGSIACGAGSAVLAIGFVDFGGKRQARVGVGPGQVMAWGRF